MKMNDEVRIIMDERFGHDNLIALGTVFEGVPYVRAVNAYYEDGAFYVVTYALSNKMKHMLESSRRASWAEGTLRLHGKWNSRGESFSELPISGGQMQAMPFPFCAFSPGPIASIPGWFLPTSTPHVSPFPTPCLLLPGIL